MMRLETARRFALSLPDTSEEPHFEKSSFRVKGKIFATVPVGGEVLHVFVGDEASVLVAEDPDAFEVIRSARGVPVDDWIRVKLRRADSRLVREMLENAWRCKAPKRARDSYDSKGAV